MTPLCLSVAFLLDVILGDPPRLPHPVRWIGWMISSFENLFRRCLPGRETLAGILTVLMTLGITALVVAGTGAIASGFHPAAGLLVTLIWLYLGFATRSLSDHARRVAADMARGDLPAARASVSRIVGRDTATLDASGISRATVESVAESTVDGVLSPLFFAVIGGPVGLWIFKAASTCDSMIGHKDDRYIRFGTFGARLDDVLNYIPARIAFILFPAAAFLTGQHAADSWRIARRDHACHASPNAGIPEAAMAGALQIRLGGPASYDGIPQDNPVFGAEFHTAHPVDISRSVRIMWTVSLLALLAALAMLSIPWKSLSPSRGGRTLPPPASLTPAPHPIPSSP